MEDFEKLSRAQLLELLTDSNEHLLKLSDNVTQRLQQDLQLHQVELEMQNRELRESRAALEDTRDRYAELYDYAPVGYLSISRAKLIQNINLTGARMLGMERNQLIGKRLLSVFKTPDSKALSAHLRRSFSGNGPLMGEFRLAMHTDQPQRDIHFDSMVRVDSNGDEHCFTVMTDISELCQMQRDLQQEKEFLQKIIDGIDEPVMVIDMDYRIHRLNRVAKDLASQFGLAAESAHCYELLHHNSSPCNEASQPCPIKQVKKSRQPFKVVHQHELPGGHNSQFEVTAAPLFDQHKQLKYIVESIHDVSEHLALLEEVKQRELSYIHLAQHDPLTSLPNRLLFADRLTQAMHVAHRNGEYLAVLFLDLDHFKQFNDSFGHGFGDKILQLASQRLQQLIREDDTVSRMGGDEFTVILTDIKIIENVALVARKILSEFSLPFIIGDQTVYLGVSVGVSIYPDHGSSVDELVRNADTAMYRAKERGRGTFEYYSRDLTDKAVERVQLETSLHDALAERQLFLVYQPQIDLKSGRLCGVEALVRWQKDNQEPVPPSQFIPLAEQSGIILSLRKWVLDEACRQMQSWLEKDVIDANATISVNISGKQFTHSELLAQVKNALDKSGLAAENLELEITETIMVYSTATTLEMLGGFRDMGVKIAIDDFGTGYSSLQYLKRLPLTRLKIDQSFTAGLPLDWHDMAITRTIIALASNLSLDVLAEGIESRQQLDFLKQEGCNSGQGFFLSHPLTAKDFERFQANRKH